MEESEGTKADSSGRTVAQTVARALEKLEKGREGRADAGNAGEEDTGSVESQRGRGGHGGRRLADVGGGGAARCCGCGLDAAGWNRVLSDVSRAVAWCGGRDAREEGRDGADLAVQRERRGTQWRQQGGRVGAFAAGRACLREQGSRARGSQRGCAETLTTT
ncbi:hypothetical protein Taro_040452 [Colocasia esculenta]|uniref:Uncharacterized protein n=1 Tax=Colocasia esculenta TaxID=4460 RepID=A0A843WYF9_COLES|nr:hypothetical protein [Colocasia esculenta]